MTNCKKSKFFVRLLPTEEVDWENIKIEINREVIHVRCLQDFLYPDKYPKPRFWSFKTDGIFYNASQQTVYEVVTEGVIQSVYEGVNTVIMACGQTCSGKSFTMGALRSIYEHRGIVPRFITDIFNDKALKTKEWQVNISMSFIEISGSRIYDLMACPDTISNIKKISIIGLHSKEQALGLVFKGEGVRRFAPNSPYLGANVTNVIITFHFNCLSLIRSNAVLTRSKVHFVDLAGIETVGKRGLTSFKEATVQGTANLAKSKLEQVLHSLTNLDSYHNDPKIKRSCKLTEYLGSAFTKGSILRFIGHIRPTFADLEVSLSTLKFGLKVKHIPTVPLTQYSEPNSELMFENIQEELNQLKEQMLVERLLSGSCEIQSGNFSQARLEHLERLASAYLQGWSSEANVLGNTEHIIILKIFKELFAKKNEEYEAKVIELQQKQLEELERRLSRSTRPSKIFKEELIDGGKGSSTKGKPSFRESGKKARGYSKLSNTPKAAPAALPISAQDKDEFSENGVLSAVSDVIPEISQKKMWEEFLSEQNIGLRYFEDFADSVRRKKVAYEIAAEEYNDTRINLERNRLTLKEIAWKRHNGKNELYDRFGQIIITQEERTAAKLVSSLEFEERSSKKMLETRYNEWKEVSKEFLQEKLKLEEKFREYCYAKHHTHMSSPFEKYAFSFEEPKKLLQIESTREKAKKYYNQLQRKLLKK